MQDGDNMERMKKTGIIVIDDAWPVTDALCVAFADWFMAQVPPERACIIYARMNAGPGMFCGGKGNRNVEFRSLADGNDNTNARQQLEDVVDWVPDERCPILILQEKSFIGLFYEMLAEPPFLERIRNAFGLVAADYAVGKTICGTDILRRIGSGVPRILISANPEHLLRPDWSSVCDERIDKSAIEMTSLARQILDAKVPRGIRSTDNRDEGRSP